jgi:hypothetical protein
MPPGLTDPREIARRIALVKAARLRAFDEGRELTIADLDQLLPPVDCARNRTRPPKWNRDQTRTPRRERTDHARA